MSGRPGAHDRLHLPDSGARDVCGAHWAMADGPARSADPRGGASTASAEARRAGFTGRFPRKQTGCGSWQSCDVRASRPGPNAFPSGLVKRCREASAARATTCVGARCGSGGSRGSRVLRRRRRPLGGVDGRARKVSPTSPRGRAAPPRWPRVRDDTRKVPGREAHESIGRFHTGNGVETQRTPAWSKASRSHLVRSQGNDEEAERQW